VSKSFASVLKCTVTQRNWCLGKWCTPS